LAASFELKKRVLPTAVGFSARNDARRKVPSGVPSLRNRPGPVEGKALR
jgi:hypothetical protein